MKVLMFGLLLYLRRVWTIFLRQSERGDSRDLKKRERGREGEDYRDCSA